MDFSFSEDQLAIRAAIEKVCARFDDAYWLKKDAEGGFPDDFHQAFARDGWLGIAMPEQYGGAGLGITEAAIMLQAISASGAGMSGASAVHMNIWGVNPVVVFGTDEQKKRFLPPLIEGRDRACFCVTEPDTGLARPRRSRRADRHDPRRRRDIGWRRIHRARSLGRGPHRAQARRHQSRDAATAGRWRAPARRCERQRGATARTGPAVASLFAAGAADPV